MLNSGSFLISALLISTCAVLAPAPEPGEPAGPGLAGHFRNTLGRIRQSPVLRQIAVGWSITTFVKHWS